MRWIRGTAAVIAAALVPVVAAARPAAADPGDLADPADPDDARVITVPTAWLAAPGALRATLGLDHRGDGAAIASYGLGAGEVELGIDSDVRGDRGGAPVALRLARAAVRIGARQGAWFSGMPAIAIGVRIAFAADRSAVAEPRATDAYAVASRDLGAIRVHAGIDALSASVAGRRAAAALRPLAGLELHPAMYPRSSLIGDVAWEPELDADHGPSLRWLLGVGVRYRAFAWAAIELAVRARQGDDLGGSTVLVRVDAFARP